MDVAQYNSIYISGSGQGLWSLLYYIKFCSEEEINGAAFKRLSNEDLTEMGFKRGPRMNITDIIKDLKQTDAEV